MNYKKTIDIKRWHGHGGMGANPYTFCQDGARDFFKIYEEIIEGGSSKSSEK